MIEEQKFRNEIDELKRELDFYKGLVERLPLSFIYEDSTHGKKAVKEKKEDSVSIESISETVTNGKREFSFISEEKIPFEEIESFLNPILDLVPHHIVFINRHGQITLCNNQVAKDLKVDREEMIGKHIRELLHIPDHQINLLETLRTGKSIVDREVLDKNYGINNTRIIRNPDGSIERVMGAFQFLNTIKEAERQAIAGRIAAGIAHEIRNPLTTVRGYLQLLQSRVDKETAALFSSLLIPEIDRANKIITDFLRIAKPSKTTEEEIQVSEFVNDFLGNFLNSEALLYNVEMVYDISDSVANCSFIGDRDELFQVFINLFRNSLQAKSDRLLRIKICTRLVGRSIQITFSDNGKGIPSSILSHVFDPFFTTKDDGTGLGLSVSKKIIENHNGLMRVTSSDQGTSFIIDIPASIKGE
ncbi:nitrogen regulation protein NR(II) [Cytobacillus sp. FJAT-54145]|uniref:histidine kinase n=1 Tax=Cytobacillus spartinae TaxID=3299023 RepID=A0ABW6KGH5_9BACI